MSVEATGATTGQGEDALSETGGRRREDCSGDRSSRRFLGWQIVCVAFVAQLVMTGVSLSAIGNFVGPVSAAFGISDSLVGTAPAFAILVMGIVGPAVGRGLDAGWTRQMMLFGGALTGAGLILLSNATEPWQLALTYVGMICFGGSLFGALPTTTLIANWFVRRRGLMLGVAYAGATVASYAVPAFAQAVMDADGWRAAVRYLGIFTLVTTLPIFATLVIVRPEDVGQVPDGEDLREEDSDVAVSLRESEPLSAGELARDARLWLMAIGFGLVMTSPLVLIGLLVPFGKTLGYSGQEANLFFLAMVPFSLIGKVVVGGLADVAPLTPSIALIVIVNLAVWAILFSDPSYPLFVATGALYGIGIGGAAPLHGVMVGRCFGRENFGTAGGLGGLATIPLIVLAVIASQTIKGMTGSHHASFVLQAGLLALGGVLLAFVRIPPPVGKMQQS